MPRHGRLPGISPRKLLGDGVDEAAHASSFYRVFERSGTSWSMMSMLMLPCVPSYTATALLRAMSGPARRADAAGRLKRCCCFYAVRLSL